MQGIGLVLAVLIAGVLVWGYIRRLQVLKAETPRCPCCGALMIRRTGPYGDFWGCTRYPDCRGTLRINS